MTLPAASAERIAFKHQNAADLRGLVNVLTAFRAACLAEPVTPGLPAQLVPDGYRIVTRSVHMWGREDGSFPDTLSLDMAASLPADVSYYLNATLLSKPNDFFVIADSYGDLTTWRTECRATRRCRFDVIPRIDQQGIDVTIVFRGEEEK